MSTPNPACLVNGSATPQDVTASASFTIALADATGVRSWTPTVVSTDETNTVAAVAATVVVNPVAKTATCTAPAAGSAVRFLSTVFDANGNVFTTTFVINVLSAASTRVLALDESFEQDAVHGYLGKLNPILRSGGGGGGGGGGGQSPGTVVAGLNSNVNSGGATTLKLSGATGDFSIDGFDPVVAVPGGSTRILTVLNATAFNCTYIDQSSSASSAANRLALNRPTKVRPVLRSGSTAIFIRDSATNFWVLVHTGYVEPYSLNPADYGTLDHLAADNQPAIQAACDAAVADFGRRPVVIPSSRDVNVYYEIASPVVITGGSVVLRGENRAVSLRPGFLGPAVVTRPVVAAPTPVKIGNFWCIPCAGAGDTRHLYLNTLGSTNLNGLSGLTVDWGWQTTSAGTNGIWFSSHGRRELSLVADECFTATLTGTGQFAITFTTSLTGKQTFTTTIGNALANGTYYSLRVTFDGHKMRAYINGNYDSGSTSIGATSTGLTVTFAAAGHTMTRSAGSFITDGFVIGQLVTVPVGSTLNAAFSGVVTGVSTSVLTFASGVVNEGPIGGVTITGKETLVQKFEDFVLFGQSTDWPLGDLSTFTPVGNFGSTFRVLNTALTTAETASAYTPPTNEIAYGSIADGTLIMLNFDPTSAPGQSWDGTASYNAAAMIIGQALIGAIGINFPAYLLWMSPVTTQQAPCTIEDLTVTGATASIGFWIDQCPSTTLRRLTTAACAWGLILNNNSYLATVDDVYLVVSARAGSAGSTRVPKACAFLTKDGGPQDIRGVNTVGGDIGAAMVKGSGSFSGRSYCLPDGAAGIMYKSQGENAEWLHCAANPGDEGHLQTDAAIIITGPQGTTAVQGTANVTNSVNVVGTSTHWNTLGTALVAGVTQLEFSSQPGVRYTVATVTDDTHLTLAIAYNGTPNGAATMTLPAGGFGLSVKIVSGQIQQLSSNAPALIIDGGTELVVDAQIWANSSCPYAIKFLALPDQAVTVRGGQNIGSRGGGVIPWMAETGADTQGFIIVENIRGKTHHVPMPDANYTLPMVDFFGGTTLKFVNGVGLLAGRTVLLPLVRGYERWIVNTTGQTLTFQGANVANPGGIGTTVSVATGTKQLITCEDASVGGAFTNWV